MFSVGSQSLAYHALTQHYGCESTFYKQKAEKNQDLTTLVTDLTDVIDRDRWICLLRFLPETRWTQTWLENRSSHLLAKAIRQDSLNPKLQYIGLIFSQARPILHQVNSESKDVCSYLETANPAKPSLNELPASTDQAIDDVFDDEVYFDCEELIEEPSAEIAEKALEKAPVQPLGPITATGLKWDVFLDTYPDILADDKLLAEALKKMLNNIDATSITSIHYENHTFTLKFTKDIKVERSIPEDNVTQSYAIGRELRFAYHPDEHSIHIDSEIKVITTGSMVYAQIGKLKQITCSDPLQDELTVSSLFEVKKLGYTPIVASLVRQKMETKKGVSFEDKPEGTFFHRKQSLSQFTSMIVAR